MKRDNLAGDIWKAENCLSRRYQEKRRLQTRGAAGGGGNGCERVRKRVK